MSVEDDGTKEDSDDGGNRLPEGGELIWICVGAFLCSLVICGAVIAGILINRRRKKAVLQFSNSYDTYDTYDITYDITNQGMEDMKNTKE